MKPFQPPGAPVTRAIVLTCVGIQLAATLGGTRLSESLALQAGLVPARLSGAVTGVAHSLPAPLTLVSSLFLHAGWLHLALNLVFLLWVGKHCEWLLGRWRFVALYLVAGIAGGLLQYLAGPHSLAPVVGASGAIAGVFGTYVVLFAQSRVASRTIAGIALSSELLTASWYAATWIGLQLLTGLALNTGGQGIAIWAHIGGFVTGLVFAQPFVRRDPLA